MAIPQISKRMSALPAMPTEHDAQNSDTVQDIQDNVNGVAAEWVIGVDSLRRTDAPAGYIEGSDGGTKYIPMSRIAMRDTHGKIPAHMLPSYIDDMMFGSMIFETNKAKFIETYVDPSTGTTQTRTYTSPTGQGENPPPDNIIFVDSQNSTNPSHQATGLQFRYFADRATTSPRYGFEEVPGSRAIVPGYGIEITPDQYTAAVTIDAKKADFFTSYGVSTAETVNSTASNLPLASGSIENSVIEATIASNRLTKLTNLIGGARYAMNLQIECTPVALSANIIDVSVTCGTVPAMKQQMDMSGPTGTSTVLNYFCEFKTGDNNTELTVTIAAEEAITVKTTRFTVFELL